MTRKLAIFCILSFCLKSFAGDATRGGGDACEISFRDSLVQAAHWLQDHAEILDYEEALKLRPIFTGNSHVEVIDPISNSFYLLDSGKLHIRCTDRPLSWNGVEKTAISTGSDAVDFVDREFDITVNRALWSRTISNIEKISLACHEIAVLAGVEVTDDYHICEKVGLLAKGFSPSKPSQVVCQSSDQRGAALLTLRLQPGQFALEYRRTEGGISWRDGLRPDSTALLEWLLGNTGLPPEPPIVPPWEGDTWTRISPQKTYSHELATKCVFGSRDRRLFSCGTEISSELHAENDGEAFVIKIRKAAFPGLQKWMKDLTEFATENSDYFIFRYRLNYSPVESFEPPAELEHYEQCLANVGPS